MTGKYNNGNVETL